MVADTPTLFLMIVLASVVTALATLAISSGQDEDDGLSLWAASMLVHAAAFALLSMRGRLPDLTSIVLANALISATIALAHEALHAFLRQPPVRYLIWVPVAVTALGFFLLIDRPADRQLLASVVCSAQIGFLLLVFYKSMSRIYGRGKFLFVSGMLLLLLAFVTRGTFLLLGWIDLRQPLSNMPAQTLMLLVSFVVVMLGSLGFVFMIKDRLDERNRDLAMHDSLTGLANRRAIMQALEQQFSLAQRAEQALSVLMIDVDHFKRINDCFGHPAGDEVLRSIAQRIAERIRVQDIAGRFGGEEFLVILPGTTAEGALQLAEALRVSIAATPVLTTWQTVGATVSLGVFGGVINEAQELDSLLERADQALYRAKQNGRNRAELA